MNVVTASVRVEIGLDQHASRFRFGDGGAKRLLLSEHAHLKTNHRARADAALLDDQIR